MIVTKKNLWLHIYRGEIYHLLVQNDITMEGEGLIYKLPKSFFYNDRIITYQKLIKIVNNIGEQDKGVESDSIY